MVDTSHYRRRFQALDKDGRPVGAARDLNPAVGTDITGNPQFLVHGGEVLVAWVESERMLSLVSQKPMIWNAGPILWSIIRVGRFDKTGALIGPARTISPAPGSKILPTNPYWVEFDAGQVGLGWYEGETDFARCSSDCWPVGTNFLLVLAADLQSARSDVVSFALQTSSAGFVARMAARSGSDIVAVGGLAHNLWQEAALATLRCAQ